MPASLDRDGTCVRESPCDFAGAWLGVGPHIRWKWTHRNLERVRSSPPVEMRNLRTTAIHCAASEERRRDTAMDEVEEITASMLAQGREMDLVERSLNACARQRPLRQPEP